MGPIGPAHLRTALDMPALAALRANPALRASADRLGAAGTRPKVVIAAVMRTLLLLAWAILRSGRPYSPTYRAATTASVAQLAVFRRYGLCASERSA